MKRHVQTTGVRNWSGDAFVELQREPLMALEAVLQDLGDCIVQGCQVSRREDGTYDVSSGYVALQGIDRGVMGDQSAQRILLMPFAGVQRVAMPMYIVPQETVVNRVYNDGATKPIAYVWQAVYSASQPEAGGYVTLTAAGGRSWRDAMQDATHRMVSDAKINVWDAKADKSGEYPNMTVGNASMADTATSAASATKATQDEDGNKISKTYLKRSGGTMTGTLVHKKGDGYLHTDVASLKIPTNHTGWIALCFGQATRTYLGEIDLLAYTQGAVSVDFTGTVSPSSGAAAWYYGRYGLRGSISSTPPEVVFARKDATGDCYLLLGGDGFAWSSYSFASLSKIVSGGLGATGSDLGITFSALSGDFASLGMTRMTLSAPKAPSEGIEVERARQADAATRATQDGDGNNISATYLPKSGGMMTGTLVQKKSNCSIHTDVASYRMPDNHTGWVRIDFGLMNVELLAVIDLIVYGKGGISIDFSGYTYVGASNPTENNWYAPKYGIRGSLDAPMPIVRFAKDNTTGRRYIMIGGDSFKWGPYGFVSLSKVVLGSLGNTTGDLGVSIEAVSGNYADLGLTNSSVSNPSVSIEVELARQATLADTLGEDAYTSSQVVGAKGELSTAEDEFPKDLDSIKTPGIYAITSRNTGQPSGYAYGVLCVFTAMKEGNNRTVQMFTSSKSRDGGFVSRSFVRYQFDNLLNWAFTPWVELVDTYDLPAKATTEADGLMSKEDKTSLDYLDDTAGKLVILGEVTEVAELNGHPCTIKSKTAAGVTVEVIRTLSGFNINHNLGEDIFVSITPCSNDFNYRTSIWENTITVSASSKWPYDANNINWGKFAFAVFKYK